MYLSTDPKAYVDRCHRCDQTEKYWEHLSTDSQRPVDRCRRQKCQSSVFWQNCLCLSTDGYRLSTDATDQSNLKSVCCKSVAICRQILRTCRQMQRIFKYGNLPSYPRLCFSSPTILHMETQLYKHPFEENLVQKQPQPKNPKAKSKRKEVAAALLQVCSAETERSVDPAVLKIDRRGFNLLHQSKVVKSKFELHPDVLRRVPHQDLLLYSELFLFHNSYQSCVCLCDSSVSCAWDHVCVLFWSWVHIRKHVCVWVVVTELAHKQFTLCVCVCRGRRIHCCVLRTT